MMLQFESAGLEVFGGIASAELAEAVATELGVVACMPSGEFANGEVSCSIPESIRGKDTYIIQSHTRHEYDDRGEVRVRSPQDALMEQIVMVNAARSAWAGRVIAVAPFMGYGRQDRRTGRQAVTASLAMQMLRGAGADGVMSIDMHSPQAEGFFEGPFEHLTAAPTLVEHVRQSIPDGQLVVVSPDNGRIKSAMRFRDQFGDRAGIAAIDKKRNSDGSATASLITTTSVEGLPCVILDDMIDGGGTIAAAAEVIQDEGAASIMAVATHGLFSGRAAERLADSPVDTIVVTDTVPLPAIMRELEHPRLQVVSIASFLARAINYVHTGKSIEALHEGMPQRI